MCSTVRPVPLTRRRSLLLHGFPSSSRMWQPLIDRLADRYRMIAPDYPGFGHSDAPPPDSFSYSFDHIADYIERFTDDIGLTRHSLVVQDYGGPIGMRLVVRRPDRLSALIVHNAVCNGDGLGPLWETRRAFWSDRARHEQALRENFFSPTATRLRHVGHSPEPDRYDPDLWTDEVAFLNRPANAICRPTCFTTTAPTWRAIRSGNSGYARHNHRCWWCGAATTRPSR
jgi:pimeloyl-ACP methyl ester carboxylesterase